MLLLYLLCPFGFCSIFSQATWRRLVNAWVATGSRRRLWPTVRLKQSFLHTHALVHRTWHELQFISFMLSWFWCVWGGMPSCFVHDLDNPCGSVVLYTHLLFCLGVQWGCTVAFSSAMQWLWVCYCFVFTFSMVWLHASHSARHCSETGDVMFCFMLPWVCLIVLHISFDFLCVL